MNKMSVLLLTIIFTFGSMTFATPVTKKQVLAPEFSVVVALSPKAAAKLTELNETISLIANYDVDFHNGTDPETTVNEVHVDVPVGGGPAKIAALDVTKFLTGKAEFFGIEYYAVSARHSGPDNYLDCGINLITPAQLVAVKDLPLGVYCKLIGE